MSNPQRVVSGLFKNYRPLESFGILWNPLESFGHVSEDIRIWIGEPKKPAFIETILDSFDQNLLLNRKGALSTTYPNVPLPAGNNLRNTLSTGTT
jgi:hypothetical protein